MGVRNDFCIDDKWGFIDTFDDSLISGDYSSFDVLNVRIPHTVKELPFHYFDEHEYQMVSAYVRDLEAPKEWEGKAVIITFEGVAHDACLYVNGNEVCSHHCGYTAFSADISEYLKFGDNNKILVKVDSRESLNVPPFGFVIDYMTYGGIYRDVKLSIRNKTYIEDVFIKTDIDFSNKIAVTTSDITLSGDTASMKVRQAVRPKDEGEFLPAGNPVFIDKTLINQTYKFDIDDIKLWDIDNPNLYEVLTELVDKDGNVVDDRVDVYGYRKAVFKKDGFYLNNNRVLIRGLNRHQAYPYVGYAMPKSMQVMDAKILKSELGLNAVRTSHYPQDQKFISACDELGLMVFTEFPGWQHIGDEKWKKQALANVGEMITQYRNHPSIILWGVRINESVDDDELYTKTNDEARRLDPTRQTGGVRCYKKGSFLEDVFTYNDFSHDGKKPGCEKKSAVTPDVNKPYMISEYNGHMYPTKSYDWEEHRFEHARRHANVLDEVIAKGDICGSFGWCMSDYNTHKDFGSGDRICYHGVTDMFRNPKQAAFVYAMQQDEIPVLELSSSMDIGEHPGCNRGEIFIYTNADSVKMYKNDVFIKEYTNADSPYKHLKHGPIRVDDYIGSTLEENEKMSHKQAETVKSLLNDVARTGLYGMTKSMYLKAGKCMLLYGMKMEDAVALFNKYIGNWGGTSTAYKFEAIKNGNVVKTTIKTPMTKRVLQTNVSHTELKEDYTYDVALVRISLTDEYGNVLPFANDALVLKCEGCIELIGPEIVSLQGGMFGTYVKTTGEAGRGRLTITTATGEYKKIDFNVTI